MKAIGKLLNKKDYIKDLADRHKYISQEFQDYGYRIAAKLGEEKMASLYIKLAKERPRALIDQAFSFAVDYPSAKNRGKLFMWKLKELEAQHPELVKKHKEAIKKEKAEKKKSEATKKKSKKKKSEPKTKSKSKGSKKSVSAKQKRKKNDSKSNQPKMNDDQLRLV